MKMLFENALRASTDLGPETLVQTSTEMLKQAKRNSKSMSQRDSYEVTIKTKDNNMDIIRHSSQTKDINNFVYQVGQ